MVGSCQRPGEGPQEGTHRAASAAREESRRVAALARRTPRTRRCAVDSNHQHRRSPPHGRAGRRQPCAIPSPVMPFKN